MDRKDRSYQAARFLRSRPEGQLIPWRVSLCTVLGAIVLGTALSGWLEEGVSPGFLWLPVSLLLGASVGANIGVIWNNINKRGNGLTNPGPSHDVQGREPEVED